MKKAIALITITILALNVFAQQVIMEQKVTKDTVPSDFGPNLKNFSHFYTAFGIIAGAPEGYGATIRYGNSSDFNMGFRYKRKLSNFYSMGFDLGYGLTSFKLKQDLTKIFPNAKLHHKEKIHFNHLRLTLYNRFNFGKRGNYIGNFLDIAAYGDWEFSAKHIYFDKHPLLNNDNASAAKVINTGLAYTNPFNYGVQTRIGFNRYVLYGSYRLSELFKDQFSYPELPRLVIGLQISMHG